MWRDLDPIWQEAIMLAWEAYQVGTIPIGCVITNQEGEIISRGRNMIFDKLSTNPLARTSMAHAEMTALINLKAEEHPNIRTYTLYTTLEPCPMCFGTMVMMNIRNISFGGRDGLAGSSVLNESMGYISNKGIKITRGPREIEVFQLALQTAFECNRNIKLLDKLLEAWSAIDESSVAYGKKLLGEDYFQKALLEKKSIDKVYDEVLLGFYNFEPKIRDAGVQP